MRFTSSTSNPAKAKDSSKMEKTISDHVVLFRDQHNLNPSENGHAAARNVNPPHPTRIKTLNRLHFSKPKSRFLEYNYPPLTAKRTVLGGGDGDDESDEDQMEEDSPANELKSHEKKKKRKLQWRLVEWALFLIILTLLLSSLTIGFIKNKFLWSLEIWKWCLVMMVTFSGRLVSGWVVAVVVFFIERNFMLREKVLYFIYGLRKSIRNCLWLGLVLLTYWTLVFDELQKKEKKILNKVFQALVAVLIGATIWLVKIVSVKMLASSFHVTAYFDRMKESVFHNYILESLSGPPREEVEQNEQHNLTMSKSMSGSGKGRKWKTIAKNFGSRKIDMDRLREMSMESPASAWTVKSLVKYVRSSGLSTIYRTVDGFGCAESEIDNEWEARNCAQRIFENVAKLGAK